MGLRFSILITFLLGIAYASYWDDPCIWTRAVPTETPVAPYRIEIRSRTVNGKRTWAAWQHFLPTPTPLPE